MTKLKDVNGDTWDMYQEVMKPYLEAKIKDGKQTASFLFRSVNSVDPGAYDYVAVDIYDSFAQIYNSREETMKRAQKVFAEKDLMEIGKRAESAARPVSIEIYESMMEAFPGPADGNSENFKFVALYYLDVQEDITADFMKAFST